MNLTAAWILGALSDVCGCTSNVFYMYWITDAMQELLFVAGLEDKFEYLKHALQLSPTIEGLSEFVSASLTRNVANNPKVLVAACRWISFPKNPERHRILSIKEIHLTSHSRGKKSMEHYLHCSWMFCVRHRNIMAAEHFKTNCCRIKINILCSIVKIYDRNGLGPCDYAQCPWLTQQIRKDLCQMSKNIIILL